MEQISIDGKIEFLAGLILDLARSPNFDRITVKMMQARIKDLSKELKNLS